MKVLIAAADRDLLSSLREIVALDGNEVVTVFDGSQAVSVSADKTFDLALLDCNLTRIETAEVTDHLLSEGVRVIVLSDRKIRLKNLLSKSLPSSYLTYPFRPDELLTRIKDVMDKSSAQEKFILGNSEIDASKLTLGGKIRITNEEAEVAGALSAGENPAGDAETIITALNEKLSASGDRHAIRYLPGKGYVLTEITSEREETPDE